MIRIFRALLRAESIKLRRSGALIVALAAPALATLLQLLHLIGMIGDAHPRWTSPAVVWADLMAHGWDVWLVLIVPMLITFEAASLANLEHRGNQWKQLFATPVPRWAIYATKIFFCALLVAGGALLFAAGFTASTLMFSGVEGLHLASAIPWLEILRITGKAFLTSGMAIVIQSWLSARFAGFVAPVGIGFGAWVGGFLFLGVHESFLLWYPWTMAIGARSGGSPHSATLLPILSGCAIAVVLGVLACRDSARRRDQA
jgi:hypothetical protein